MLRGATMALTVVLLAAMALPAGETSAKKLLGTWSRTKDDATVHFKFQPDGLHFFSESALGKLDLEVDYGVSKDGKVLFGRIRTVKEGLGPVKGDLLSFGFTIAGDTLNITDWKGTGVVGLAAALQGEYKKEAKKE